MAPTTRGSKAKTAQDAMDDVDDVAPQQPEMEKYILISRRYYHCSNGFNGSYEAQYHYYVKVIPENVRIILNKTTSFDMSLGINHPETSPECRIIDDWFDSILRDNVDEKKVTFPYMITEHVQMETIY